MAPKIAEPSAASAADADASTLTELGLPSWLDAMLQPGVGDGVFMTLKATLVGLILVLLTMCYFIEDPVCPGQLKDATPRARRCVRRN